MTFFSASFSKISIVRTLSRIALSVVPVLLITASLTQEVLAQGEPAAAQQVFAPAPAPEQQAPPSFFTALTDLLPVIILCYGIFYFMVIKPQESSAKKQKALLEALKKGDEVVTSGGMHGRIVSTEQDAVTLELAPNVKVKVELSHIKRRLADEKKAA